MGGAALLDQGAELVGAAIVPEGDQLPDWVHEGNPPELASLPPFFDPRLASESGQLREHYLRRGVDLADAAELGERGIAPIAGGATGAGGAAFMHNLPPEGSYVMDSTVFFRETERNDVPQEQKAFTGLGGAPIDLRISNVGILAKIRLVFVGTLTVTTPTGTCTANYPWPWNVLKRFTLNANGQTSLISCEGADLRARERRMYRNARDQVSAIQGNVGTTTDAMVDPNPGTIAAGAYSIALVYDIPIVHDDYTLTGAIFAQSDQTYLNWRITPAATAELFTLSGTATAAITGTIHSTLTFFDIPYADTREGRKTLIPDLQWLHGYLGADAPFAATGRVRTPFIRTAGQLLSYTFQVDNGGAAVISPAALNGIEFGYGGNRTPRVFNPPAQLLSKNAQDYNGRIMPNAGYAVLDFEVDNPVRDVVYPKGVAELQLTVDVASGTTINSGAHLHFVEETLFAGR
jgi:hypothetical protein